MEVEFVCLANSIKYGGRCIAGIRTDGSGWIRPVSDLQYGELHPLHYLYPNNEEPILLDIVRADITTAQPQPHQPENWLIGSRKWNKVGRYSPNEAYRFFQPFMASSFTIFGTGTDFIDYNYIQGNALKNSLALVEPLDIRWVIIRGFRGERQVRVKFQIRYPYWNESVVTDPFWQQRLAHLKSGEYPRHVGGLTSADKLLFTISLAERPLENGRRYKLVAAVIVLPGV
ncbi:MAG: hypothetical protein HY532_02430 [Chloroflexi bacterium]|nr:hypothetical protein [Chloroflexota bacterium]